MELTPEQIQRAKEIYENNERQFGGSSTGDNFQIFATICDLAKEGLINEKQLELADAYFMRSIVGGMDNEDAQRIVGETRRVGQRYLDAHPEDGSEDGSNEGQIGVSVLQIFDSPDVPQVSQKQSWAQWLGITK